MNRLYFGDNLKWLSDRKEFPDASVDLVYLDPPFNSTHSPTRGVGPMPPRRIISSSTTARMSRSSK